MQGKFAFALYD
jgi:asparagine synthase (glutamine-hydrolysing)